MGTASELLLDLTLVLGVAGLTSLVCQRLGQPMILGYLLAGLVVGPNVPIPLFADPDRVATLSELGVIFVMFGIGLEFSLRKLLRTLPRAGVVTALQMGLLMWLGLLVGRLLGWSSMDSLFIGAALCISSTMVVAKTFAELGTTGRHVEHVYAILVAQDFMAVVLIAVLTGLVSTSGGPDAVPAGTVAGTLASLAAFLAAMIVGGFLVVPRLVRLVARRRHPETLLIVSVGLCFAFSELAQAAGFSVALGAFLAGSLVAESGESHQVERLVRSLRDVFAAIFFVTVGMLVDPAGLLDQALPILLFSGLVLVFQPAILSVGSFLVGHDIRTSVRTGTSLAQVGEFGFIIAGVGVRAGVVSPSLFTVVVAVSTLTCLLTPRMMRLGGPLSRWIDRHLPRKLQTYVSLYASWIESLRQSAHRRSLGALVRRGCGWLALDAGLLAGVLIGAAASEHALRAWITDALGAPDQLAMALLLLVAAAAAMPFVLGIVRIARSLGSVLARGALPGVAEGQVDFAATPRQALRVTLQLLVLLGVLVPLMAIVQPFLTAGTGALLVLVPLLALGVHFWRGTTEVADHARAGAEIVAQLLARHAERGAERPTQTQRVELESLQEMLPGLGTLLEVRIAPGAAVVGRSLGTLDLRGRTGATVLAIVRGEQSIVVPAGSETLQSGDLLCLAGAQEALVLARESLVCPDQPAGVPADGGAGDGPGQPPDGLEGGLAGVISNRT